jgi:hypothetical protein
MEGASMSETTRGRCHTDSVLSMLKQENAKINEDVVLAKAQEVIDHCVNQPAGETPGQTPTSDVLIYGPIQSGKTSVITAAVGVALDTGFRCIIVLTSDINILYKQTYDRLSNALKTVAVKGKGEWSDIESLKECLANSSVVLVCSKNVSKLKSLLDALRRADARNLPSLIIDDEADQASLNTNARNVDEEVSAVNAAINDLRIFFESASFVQATATPQALFLQQAGGAYRPRSTVLTEPGSDYIGGSFFFDSDRDSLFGSGSPLREVDQKEVLDLAAKKGPKAGGSVPNGLRKALNSFFVAASVKLISRPMECYAFLCHVSAKTVDHRYLAKIITQYYSEMAEAVKSESRTPVQQGILSGLRSAYDDLQDSDQTFPSMEQVLAQIALTIRSTAVRIINAGSEDESKVDRPYCIFVGGNKLSRGVTIANLLVSYYGRNPKQPNADTVLQHARMYGYRGEDASLTRLYLPSELAKHFANISQMESSLRILLKKYPDSHVEGIPLEKWIRPTRPNVVPKDITTYIGGGTYNPILPLFFATPTDNMRQIDDLVSKYSSAIPYDHCSTSEVIRVVELSEQDPRVDAVLWNPKVLVAVLEELSLRYGPDAYIRVRIGRRVTERRRETQGILTGGEAGDVPDDRVALFIYKMEDAGKTAWWPQLRLPNHDIVLYFNPETIQEAPSEEQQE